MVEHFDVGMVDDVCVFEFGEIVFVVFVGGVVFAGLCGWVGCVYCLDFDLRVFVGVVVVGDDCIGDVVVDFDGCVYCVVCLGVVELVVDVDNVVFEVVW